MQQLWTLLIRATIKTLARQAGFATTKAEAAKCRKYQDLQSNYHFQLVAIMRPLVCMASPLPLFFEWYCKETC